MRLDVEVNGVTLKYGAFEALHNISFRLESGKICGLVGRNGAGKTSLLSLLASFREPTAGSIRIGGEDPFENARIMPHVTFVYAEDLRGETENVQGMLEAAKRYRPHFDSGYAEELAQRFELPMNKPVHELSRGMQSALNVTIGLASRSPVTIFDEAYLGMDAPTRELFYRELLDDQARHPRTVILSTHLVSEMDYLFDEVIILHKGKLVLHEGYEDLIGKGASVTGPSKAVDEFVKGMKQLHAQQLGDTKSVVVYGKIADETRLAARERQLDIGPVSLQDLFIHLTSEEE
ncbi:MAG: ABC transporter [Cohnella sp.]|jgi:ABC-2 type transport system ATP-binding protein|uniref:ATP-binding cassette domain-containing protein n=1 Tax=Cohnella sp. TaxID=1883426 RepID=UPI000E3797CE|nr:ABC transporter ATP-binding protein [Cohnella sp.]REK60582.1 MAG: ABC transporter [Cohnella sp.]